MPPRYAYWTILVDDQPTAFRSGSKEELLPTFNRLKEKHASAVMRWFQNGKLWDTRLDAQEAMRARGEMGRRGDSRQRAPRSFSEGGSDRPRSFGAKGSDRPRPSFRDRERPAFRDRERPAFRDRDERPAREPRDGERRGERPEWQPKKSDGEARAPRDSAKREGPLDWKPKGEFVPAPKRADRAERSDWKPARSEKPEWRPKSPADRDRKPFNERNDRGERPEWRPKSPSSGKGGEDRHARGPRASHSEKPEWKPKSDYPVKAKSDRRQRWSARGPKTSERPDWKPKASSSQLDWTPKSGHTGPKPEDPEKRKWVPKAEYKKSLGIEAKRDSKWRPGGEHRDPKQKYKDAKKAKWGRFKETIRKRWESKSGKKEK